MDTKGSVCVEEVGKNNSTMSGGAIGTEEGCDDVCSVEAGGALSTTNEDCDDGEGEAGMIHSGSDETRTSPVGSAAGADVITVPPAVACI